jgi:hypothetical protein
MPAQLNLPCLFNRGETAFSEKEEWSFLEDED